MIQLLPVDEDEECALLEPSQHSQQDVVSRRQHNIRRGVIISLLGVLGALCLYLISGPKRAAPLEFQPNTMSADDECHTAVPGELCYKDVTWAMRFGIYQHPEWYPGMTPSSTFEEFQSLLYVKRKAIHGSCHAKPCPLDSLYPADEADEDETEPKTLEFCYNCKSDLLLETRAMEHKGLALDDTSFMMCPEMVPAHWPNTQAKVKSIRLFKSGSEMPEPTRKLAWKMLKHFADRNDAQIFLASRISCNKTLDEMEWKQTKELMALLGRKRVMGLAIGNELELLYTHKSEDCIDTLWGDTGYYFTRFKAIVQELDGMDGFDDLPLTSVWGEYVLAGEPFVETPESRVLTFLRNVTDLVGDRFVFTVNIYPYFDTSIGLDDGRKHHCSHAIEFCTAVNKPGGYLQVLSSVVRQRVTALTGSDTAKVWIGETGWSFPKSSTLDGPMQNCTDFSSQETFKTFYSNFLDWDLSVGSYQHGAEVRGPDHIFYFTLRDSIQFGVTEHFGLIEGCESTKCKLQDI